MSTTIRSQPASIRSSARSKPPSAVARQIAEALEAAHERGIIHRDLKPANILLEQREDSTRLILTDFGIAKILEADGGQTLTGTGVGIGTPEYMAPEQWTGEADPRTDVYSLGVVLYEMLAGRPPFVAKTAETLARLHREALPQPPSEFNPRITPELEQIMLKVLSKEPAARYRTADQFGRVLMTFGQQRKPATAAPVSTPVKAAEPVSAPAALAAPTVAVRPAVIPPPPAPVTARYAPEPVQEYEPQEELDWISIGLGLLALAAVGGLIPLWIAVFFRWANLP